MPAKVMLVSEFGFDQLVRNIKAVGNVTNPENTKRRMMAGAKIIHQATRDNIRRNFTENPTGNLWEKTVIKITSNTTVEIGPRNVIYARQREFGGDIYPVKADYLIFFWRGRWYKRKHVYQKPRPYLRPAVDNNIDKIKVALEDETAEIIKMSIDRQIKEK